MNPATGGRNAAGDSPAAPNPAATPSTANRPRIALVAGEASGDLLGAGLVAALRERYPGADFAGIGGESMRDAGVDTWHDASELAVMGLSEVIAHLPRLLALRRALRRRLLAWRPDVFVGIDAPDFNLGLERWLRRRGVRTVHYVSPSVWAWRQGRAARIGLSAERVLCLFPMEPEIYARHGVDARFVGHPLADLMPMEPDRRAAREALGLSQDAPVLAVLPGSRLGEIDRLAPTFLEAAARVARAVPELQVVVPAANEACLAALADLVEASPIAAATRLRVGDARTAMVASDVVLLASGTATLEALLAKRPMVVGYRISALTHAFVKGFGLLKVASYSLPNVLAGETVVPELMQDDCTADGLAEAVLGWFSSPARMEALAPRFAAIHASLRKDASHRAAEAVSELLERQP